MKSNMLCSLLSVMSLNVEQWIIENFKVYVTSDRNNLGKPEFHVPAPRDGRWYMADIDISSYTQRDFQVH